MRRRNIIIFAVVLVLLSLPAVYARFFMISDLRGSHASAESASAEETENLQAESGSREESSASVSASSDIQSETEEDTDTKTEETEEQGDRKQSESSDPAPGVSVVSEGENGKRRILLQDSEGNASLVRFYVWSETNSQDDLVVYSGEKNADGSWEAEFDAADHKHAGNYLVQTYVNGAFTGENTFTVPYEELENTYTELAAGLEAAKTNSQLILVQAEGTEAVLSMLNKESDGNWIEILRTHAYVGENGVGDTTEWSHTTPPGNFSFGMAFGILPDPGTVFSYTQLDDSDYWVDDVDSEYYNQFVSTDEVELTWSSAEHLIEHDPSYNYALSIDYNTDCVPGVGSAIFLHCINQGATLGCVAVSEDAMKTILQNVQKDCRIIIDNGEAIRNY